MSQDGPARGHEYRFAQAMEVLGDGVFDWNVTADEVVFSPSYYAMAGYAPGEFPMTYDSWAERVYPDDYPRVSASVEDFLAGRTPVYQVTFRFRRKDDSWMWIMARAKIAKRDANGKPLKIIGTHSDIEELIEAQNAAAEREALLDSIFENVPIALLIKDANYLVERANRTYLNWCGFESETMVGYRSDEIEDFQSPEDARYMNAQEREVLTTGRTRIRQIERPFADGTVHTIRITKFPVYGQDGTIIKVGAVTVDLTEQVRAQRALVQSQARFRDFAESSSDWLWEMDDQFCFTYISERDREITGFDPALYIGRTPRNSTSEDTDRRKWRDFYGDLQNHRPFREFRYRLSGTDGRQLSIDINGKPVFAEDGEFRGYRGTGTDITERTRTEETRDEALREAERAKSEFLATMSHEFRTPLNAILGFSELLRSQHFRPLGADSYREYVDAIFDSGNHMLALVNDILDISAIEAGRRTYVKRRVDLSKVLQSCVKDCRVAADAKGNTLSPEIAPALPPLFADERSLIQLDTAENLFISVDL